MYACIYTYVFIQHLNCKCSEISTRHDISVSKYPLDADKLMSTNRDQSVMSPMLI